MKKVKKWERYHEALKILNVRGIKFDTFNLGVELHLANNIKFWPTTGTIIKNDKRLDLKGIEALLEIL